MNDIYFPSSLLTQFNNFGSFGLQQHGIKVGLRTPDYVFMFSYSYHRADGFRRHSDDYWHIMNSVLETTPSPRTRLQILGYYVDGQIHLPGSLTKEEYDSDPWQAAQKEVDYDFRRYTRKGRLGLRFTAFLDHNRKQELELTGYGTIKYFERTTKIYRIMNRYGLGLSLRYVNRNKLLGRENEFSVGGDLLHQTGPVEAYQNINGQKGDVLTGLTDETIGNRGFFFQNSTDLFRQRLYLLLSGRYDWVIFDQKNQILAVQNDVRTFHGFTPKVALNYKFNPGLSVYSSWGMSFDSPAGNELDNYPTSSEPGKLMNPDLQAQQSNNLEVGIKGDLVSSGSAFFQRLTFEASLFHYVIDNEVVPFEVFGEYFFRNSARTVRDGLELGSEFYLARLFRLKLAYTYSDFIYDQYTARTVELDNQGSLVIQDQDFSQNTVPSIPRNNLFLGLSFEKPFSKVISAFAQLSYWGVSGMYVDDANSDRTAAFQLTGITLGLEGNFNPLNLLLSIGADNIFDERYVGFININSTDQRFYEAGAPRNYFANLKIGLNF
jgi:iron complex outermembrane receptor protein